MMQINGERTATRMEFFLLDEEEEKYRSRSGEGKNKANGLHLQSIRKTDNEKHFSLEPIKNSKIWKKKKFT